MRPTNASGNRHSLPCEMQLLNSLRTHRPKLRKFLVCVSLVIGGEEILSCSHANSIFSGWGNARGGPQLSLIFIICLFILKSVKIRSPAGISFVFLFYGSTCALARFGSGGKIVPRRGALAKKLFELVETSIKQSLRREGPPKTFYCLYEC